MGRRVIKQKDLKKEVTVQVEIRRQVAH